MQVLVFDPSRCTGCHTCEETCSQTWFKEINRDKSAIQILPPANEDGPYQAITCTQCGDCIDLCPTKALTRHKKGFIRLDKKLCVGCLACVGFCSIAAFRSHPDYEQPFKCVACGQCVKACPEQALTIQDVPDAAPSATAQWEKGA